MPCNSGPSFYDGFGEFKVEIGELKAALRDCKKEADKLASLLCAFSRQYLADGRMPRSVFNWAHYHCEYDANGGRVWSVTLDSLPLDRIYEDLEGKNNAAEEG